MGMPEARSGFEFVLALVPIVFQSDLQLKSSWVPLDSFQEEAKWVRIGVS